MKRRSIRIPGNVYTEQEKTVDYYGKVLGILRDEVLWMDLVSFIFTPHVLYHDSRELR